MAVVTTYEKIWQPWLELVDTTSALSRFHSLDKNIFEFSLSFYRDRIQQRHFIIMAAQVHEFTMEMTCEGCSGAASRVLGKLGDKVSDVNVDLATKKITVTSAMTAEELTEVLKKTGKEITHLSSKSV